MQTQDAYSICITRLTHVYLPFVSLVPLWKSSIEFNKRGNKGSFMETEQYGNYFSVIIISDEMMEKRT